VDAPINMTFPLPRINAGTLREGQDILDPVAA
jgi:hypothetical protein